MAAGAGFRVAGAAYLDFGQSAVAALIIVLAGRYVASYVEINVIIHNNLQSYFEPPSRKLFNVLDKSTDMK